MVSVSEAGLSNILADHKTWVESDGADGALADLSGLKDLRGVNFTGVTLTRVSFAGSNLTRATFDKADLRNADLQGAVLQSVSFEGTRLAGADLHESDLTLTTFSGASGNADLLKADLRDAALTSADLSDVTGLDAKALAGADLTLAKLPADIAAFTGLDHVSEISKHARTNFLAVIAACVYCWLTIATTTDIALLLNSSSTPMPIIQTPVPLSGFYWAAPLLLLALYIYLHLYLQRMWEGLATLPAVFPDGRTLDERAYPWLLTGLVRAYVPKLKHNRPSLSSVQNGISIVIAWGLVPLTIALLWWRYLPRHDWWGSLLHVLIIATAATVGWMSFRLANRTLGSRYPLGDAPPPAIRYYFSGGTEWAPRVIGPTASTLLVGVFFGFTWLAIEMPRFENASLDDRTTKFHRPANLIEAELVKKPGGWQRGNPDNPLPEVVRLTGADLKSANGRLAFLANADLRRADLGRAYLTAADLQSADLSHTNLENASLNGAILVNAQLHDANLEGATLDRADLKGADLTKADLQDVRFDGADISGVNFIGSNMTQKQLDEACGIIPPRLPDGSLTFTPQPCAER